MVDTDYRRAGKLDTTHFASNFHPTEFGILENIEQILLPAIGDKANDETHSRKLIADLYKLNVFFYIYIADYKLSFNVLTA